jgi:hypothetical protein
MESRAGADHADTRPVRVAGLAVLVASAGCAAAQTQQRPSVDPTRVDTLAISRIARDLSADSMRGRGPWTKENKKAANKLTAELNALNAYPVFGKSFLVPFVVPSHPNDTVWNVIGVLPGRSGTVVNGRVVGDLIGLTAHLDHLGVGAPDASGDSIYNGFLDDALSIGMIFDIARRYTQSRGDRPLVLMFFNLEEEGLLGSQALLARPDAQPFVDRLKLLIEVDAGSPAGEALEWQAMGSSINSPAIHLADSLARVRGWKTTPSLPRPISDVFPFAQRGVDILFPIPGPVWRGYTREERDAAMKKFDHYHDPKDEWRPDFPMIGTAKYADWLWDIIRVASVRR